jgi:hypothetical protein
MGPALDTVAGADRSGWRSLPRPYRRVLAVIVSLMALALVWYTVASIYGRARTPVVDLANPASPAVLTVARGDTVYFRVGWTSVGGMWAAPSGLRIRLRDDVLQIMDPKDADWGDTISYATETKVGTELASFRVPSYPGTEHLRIEGSIDGTVDYPHAEGGSSFSDASSEVERPIVLDVVSQAEAGGLHASKPNYLPAVALRFSLLAALIVAAPGLVVVERRRRVASRARRAARGTSQHVKLDRKAKIGVAILILCGLFLVAMFTYAIIHGLNQS